MKAEEEERLKSKARENSIKEGIFATIKSSFGDNFITPFAIAINSSNSIVALMSSISGLVGPLSQIFGSRLIETNSRKSIVLKTVFLESLMWIPFIAIAVLFQQNIITNFLPILLLFSFSIYVILSYISGPAWFSWIGDIVREKDKGRWFAKRNVIHGFIAVILAILASLILTQFKERNLEMYGFMILFSLALLGRILSWNVFRKQYEPKIKLKGDYYFSFWQFLLKAPETNFGRFSIFHGFLNFACAISGPFLAIYLLKELGMNYTTYIIVTFSGTIFSLAVMHFWGEFADKYGNYKTILIGSILIPILPLLWVLSENILYLILIPSLIGGVTWAGFNLATGNFIYDNVSPQKRGLAISYFNVLNGIGIFLGAGLGAILVKYLPLEQIHQIFIIFLIGTLTRMIVIFYFVPKLTEVKEKRKFNGKSAFKNMILKHAKNHILEEVHEIMSIKRYINFKLP